MLLLLLLLTLLPALLLLQPELVLMLGYGTMLSDLIAGLQPPGGGRVRKGHLLTLITGLLVALRVKDQLSYDGSGHRERPLVVCGSVDGPDDVDCGGGTPDRVGGAGEGYLVEGIFEVGRGYHGILFGGIMDYGSGVGLWEFELGLLLS